MMYPKTLFYIHTLLTWRFVVRYKRVYTSSHVGYDYSYRTYTRINNYSYA